MNTDTGAQDCDLSAQNDDTFFNNILSQNALTAENLDRHTGNSTNLVAGLDVCTGSTMHAIFDETCSSGNEATIDTDSTQDCVSGSSGGVAINETDRSDDFHPNEVPLNCDTGLAGLFTKSTLPEGLEWESDSSSEAEDENDETEELITQNIPNVSIVESHEDNDTPLPTANNFSNTQMFSYYASLYSSSNPYRTITPSPSPPASDWSLDEVDIPVLPRLTPRERLEEARRRLRLLLPHKIILAPGQKPPLSFKTKLEHFKMEPWQMRRLYQYPSPLSQVLEPIVEEDDDDDSDEE